MVKGWCFWGLEFLGGFSVKLLQNRQIFLQNLFDGRVETMLLRVITFQKCKK